MGPIHAADWANKQFALGALAHPATPRRAVRASVPLRRRARAPGAGLRRVGCALTRAAAAEQGAFAGATQDIMLADAGAGAGADAAAPMQEEGTHRPPAPSDAPMQDARPAARSVFTAGARPCISRALPGPCLHHLPVSSCAPGARSLH